MEILIHSMEVHKQINVKQANTMYHRPVNQYASDPSMTNKVHDTISIRLVFLGLKN